MFSKSLGSNWMWWKNLIKFVLFFGFFSGHVILHCSGAEMLKKPCWTQHVLLLKSQGTESTNRTGSPTLGGGMYNLAPPAPSGSVPSPLEGFNHRPLSLFPIIKTPEGKQEQSRLVLLREICDLCMCVWQTLTRSSRSQGFPENEPQSCSHWFRQENLLVQEHIFLPLQLNLWPSSCKGPHFNREIIPSVFKYVGKRNFCRSTEWPHAGIIFPTSLFWRQRQDPGVCSSKPPNFSWWEKWESKI